MHNFNSTSTVKVIYVIIYLKCFTLFCSQDMYQFVFTKDAIPMLFVLISCSSVPKLQLDFSLKCLTDCDVHGSLIIVQKDIKIDIDCFLNLLDNVGVPIVM